MRQILAVAVLVFGAMAVNADAGVRGGHFEGTLTRPDGTPTVYLSTDFAQTGNGFVETYNYESGVESYSGTYFELDLYVVSFWIANYTDYAKYKVFGIGLYGQTSTYNVLQTDGDDDYFGIVQRTGNSAIRRPAK